MIIRAVRFSKLLKIIRFILFILHSPLMYAFFFLSLTCETIVVSLVDKGSYKFS
jgi:hypothetical protein